MRYIFMGVLIALFATSVKAQEATMGLGVICDTVEQITRYVNVYDGDARAAVAKVNEETGYYSCAYGLMTYIKGEEISTIRTTLMAAAVTRIIVVSYMTVYGMARIVPPSVQFTIFTIDERGA